MFPWSTQRVLTVDSELKVSRLGAHWVADPTLVGAMAGAEDRMEKHCAVVCRKTDHVSRLNEVAIFHPLSAADRAGGLTGEISGAFLLYQHR